MAELAGIRECAACGYETDCRWFEDGHPQVKLALCALCSATYAGNAVFWPESYPETGKVMRQINYVANAILAAIRGEQKEPS